MNLEKTEVMWIGEQGVVVDGKTSKQVNIVVYLGGTVCEDGGSSKEIQRRVEAGASAWRRVEGVMWDRKLKKQLKGKVLEACVVPACIYGLGTLPLIERHKEKMQIAENKWVRKICKEWVKTDCQKEHGKQMRLAEEEKKGRQKLRWKDCVKRDFEKTGTNGQEWKITAEDRGKWRTLTMKVEEGIKWLGLHPPRFHGEEEEE